jgi:hypothetical protein
MLLAAILCALGPGQRPRRMARLAEACALLTLLIAVAALVELVRSGSGSSALLGVAGIGLSARLDAVSASMLLLVGFVGWVVVRYTRTYLDGEARQGAFTGWLCTLLAAVLLILDEVQTGIGRTGTWFAHQRAGITPDVMTLAKGLGGGLPMGAVVTFGAASAIFTPGSHGTTFGGNPVCAAAALAVLNTIEAEHLLDHVDALGKHIIGAIEDLAHPLVTQVRGAGLLIGIQLAQPVAGAATAAARGAGFLTNAAEADVLRLAPPLIVTQAQADSFLAALPGILDTAAAAEPAASAH